MESANRLLFVVPVVRATIIVSCVDVCPKGCYQASVFGQREGVGRVLRYFPKEGYQPVGVDLNIHSVFLNYLPYFKCSSLYSLVAQLNEFTLTVQVSRVEQQNGDRGREGSMRCVSCKEKLMYSAAVFHFTITPRPITVCRHTSDMFMYDTVPGCSWHVELS